MSAVVAGRTSSIRVSIASTTLQAAASLSGLVRGRPGKCQGDHGATATEYALVASLIAVVIVAAVTVFGRNVSGLFLVPASVFNP
jgi:pilus assembly protein Flp/PilA